MHRGMVVMQQGHSRSCWPPPRMFWRPRTCRPISPSTICERPRVVAEIRGGVAAHDLFVVEFARSLVSNCGARKHQCVILQPRRNCCQPKLRSQAHRVPYAPQRPLQRAYCTRGGPAPRDHRNLAPSVTMAAAEKSSATKLGKEPPVTCDLSRCG